MYDKFGRYLKIDERNGRRVCYISGELFIFICNGEVPIYEIVEAVEKIYEPR